MKVVIFHPGEGRDGQADDITRHDSLYGEPPGCIYGIDDLVNASIWEDTSFEKNRIATRVLNGGKETK
jgi:hypothetical protein